MSKSQRHIKQTDLRSHQGSGRQLEQIETIDDNLLPDASEIEKLKVHDPDIMIWLKARAEQEQNFRHETIKRRDGIVSVATGREYRLNITGLLLAFIILLIGMLISAFLIYKGYVISGSIFTGSTIILGASLFIRRGKSKTEQ
jgi:hypothetical protein